jgi:hypothetical protein
MLPVLLSSFKVQDDVVTIKHTFFVTQTWNNLTDTN